MEFPLSKNRDIRLALGFDDVSLAPSTSTVDPRDTHVGFTLGDTDFDIPIIASAMDGVVDPKMSLRFTEAGSFAVFNLEGLWSRYEDPREQLERIRSASDDRATELLQELYSVSEPDPGLMRERIAQLNDSGCYSAVSLTPAGALQYADTVEDAGADCLIVQSTVTSPKHRSEEGPSLEISQLTSGLDIPVVVGNCTGYEVALELMREGVDGLLVGVGPGAACTTRGVTGVGVPQITATADVAAAREDFREESGRYVNVITDGGMRTGGDISKALAAGADLVMGGSIFAGCPESPAAPYHWGMATPDPNLPRGVRVKATNEVPLERVLFGPARVTDGSQNLVGAVRSSMGMCGAQDIREFHQTQLIFSLSFMTEGKGLQFSQHLGMGD